jgi:hypothetical protein
MDLAPAPKVGGGHIYRYPPLLEIKWSKLMGRSEFNIYRYMCQQDLWSQSVTMGGKMDCFVHKKGYKSRREREREKAACIPSGWLVQLGI